jgi:hypoxanthine phosphoribosyltransferase
MTLQKPTSPPDDGLPVSERVAATAFAHPSERVAAQILDFYGIRWEYEPTTFPIEWSAAGDVIASFSPDFYMPDFDLYIELTTMSQKLVTKKNRKVRRLRELHPDINIKIFYQKDFRALCLKYGLGYPDGAGTSHAAEGRV